MSDRYHRSIVGERLRENGIWVTALLSIGLFGGLLLFSDGRAVATTFATFDWRVLVVVVALATAGYVVRFVKWELYLRTVSIDAPLWTSAVVFFSGLMFVATPGKVGEVWKAWFMKDLSAVPASRVTSVVGAERVTDVLALGLMAALGPLVYGRSIALVIGLFAAFGAGLVVFQWESLFRRVVSVLDAVPLVTRYTAAVESMYESTATLLRPRPLCGGLALSLVAWTLEATALWVILHSYGVDGVLAQSVFVYGLGLIIGAASLLPGGLGATEVSMVGLLLSFGYERSVAVSTVLLVRMGTLGYAVLLGVAVYAAYKMSTARS